MTKEALNKLNERQMAYCKALSFLVNKAKHLRLKEECERQAAKLMGYLECLRQLKMVSDIECRCLYAWFTEKDRSEQ